MPVAAENKRLFRVGSEDFDDDLPKIGAQSMHCASNGFDLDSSPIMTPRTHAPRSPPFSDGGDADRYADREDSPMHVAGFSDGSANLNLSFSGSGSRSPEYGSNLTNTAHPLAVSRFPELGVAAVATAPPQQTVTTFNPAPASVKVPIRISTYSSRSSRSRPSGIFNDASFTSYSNSDSSPSSPAEGKQIDMEDAVQGIATEDIALKEKTYIRSKKAMVIMFCYFSGGVLSNLIGKEIFDTKVPSADGKSYEQFDGKVVMTMFSLLSDIMCLFTFFGSILCGAYPEYRFDIIGFLTGRKREVSNSNSTEGLKDSSRSGFFFSPKEAAKDDAHPGWHKYLLLWLVTGCTNMISSYFNFAGVEHLPASTVQIFRGGRVIVVSTMAKVVLRREMGVYKRIGVAFAFVGVMFVSFVAAAGEPESAGKSQKSPLLGMFYCALGAITGSAHMIIQEMVYRKARNTPPLLAVGLEGVSGIILGVGMLLPSLLAMKPEEYEAEMNALNLMRRSEYLQFLFFILMFLYGASACAGSQLGNNLPAIGRCMMECSKTGFVWVFEVVRALLTLGICGAITALPVKLNPFTGLFWMEKVGIAVLCLGLAFYFESLEPNKFKAQVKAKAREVKELIQNKAMELIFPSFKPPTKTSTNLPTQNQAQATKMGGSLNRDYMPSNSNKVFNEPDSFGLLDTHSDDDEL